MTKVPQDENGYVGGPYTLFSGVRSPSSKTIRTPQASAGSESSAAPARLALDARASISCEAGQSRWSIQTLRRFAEINRPMPATTRRPP